MTIVGRRRAIRIQGQEARSSGGGKNEEGQVSSLLGRHCRAFLSFSFEKCVSKRVSMWYFVIHKSPQLFVDLLLSITFCLLFSNTSNSTAVYPPCQASSFLGSLASHVSSAVPPEPREDGRVCGIGSSCADPARRRTPSEAIFDTPGNEARRGRYVTTSKRRPRPTRPQRRLFRPKLLLYRNIPTGAQTTNTAEA